MLLSSSRRLLPALLLWLALPCAGFAQVNQYETIGIEQGLSQGMIFDLCQTRDGFLWVATKDGLNRYDGYNFRVFTNSPFDPFSIASNSVSKLFEDARGLLWVGLNAKGVDVYEPRNGRFHHFPIAFIDSKIYNSTETTAIAEAPDGSIWFTQRSGGLWRIAIPADWQNGLPADTTSRSVQATPVPTPFERNFDNGASGESALDILCLSSGEMLVTTTYRQFAFNPKTLAFRPINEQLLGKPGGNFQFSTCGVHDPEGDRGSWFLCVNSPAHAPDLVRIRQGQRTAYTVPTTALLYRLARGKGGHTWLAMDEKVWDLAPDETPDLSRPDYELDQNAICFERDRAGNLWFGTDGYGLRKFNPTKHNFHAGAAGNSLGRIWANDGRYFAKKVFWIYNFDLQQGRLSEKPAFGGAPMRQVNLAFEPSGAAWLLGNVPEVPNGSLYYYSPGNFARPDKKYDFNVTALGEADPMLRARDGRLYIATGNWRLIRFDPAAEHFDYFDYGHLFGKQVDAVAPLSLAEDAAGAIWIGTQEGLVKCVPNAQKYDFQIIKTDPNKPDGLNNNIIACILPRPDGQIWLGTKGGGINILNEKTGRVRHLTIADGLLNNVVYGILPGNRTDEYWCSTNRGLAKIVERAQSGKLGQDFIITTFTAALGLQDNEFNTHSFYKTENGELLFGGINGLNRILPEELRADTTPPPVYIVGIEINNQKVDIRSSENLPNLELNHEQNNVSIEFAALDFTDPAKNRYRYRLVGLDQDWVETGNQRFAHFNHLAPGSYELRVQGSNGESAWRDAAPLLIVVNPPWYRSNLAYLVYLLLLAWAGWRAYQFQIQRVKEREQLAFEQRETERVKVLEQLKTNFFSNVTHEFRTPLTLILEPARQLLKNPKDPALLEKIRLIEKNGGQLLGLVNQLLDMAKLESGQMTLDLRRADLAETVRGVFERFLPLAEKRGVKLVLKNANIGRAQNASDVDASLEFEFDPNKVELVLNNLISNALKFTPEGGKVNVEWRIEN